MCFVGTYVTYENMICPNLCFEQNMMSCVAIGSYILTYVTYKVCSVKTYGTYEKCYVRTYVTHQNLIF